MGRERIEMSAAELRDFLDQQVWMLLVTLDASGAPRPGLVRTSRQGERLHFAVEEEAEATRHIERDARVCLCNDEYPTYYEIRGVTVHGQAIPASDPTGLEAPGYRVFALGLEDVVSFDFSKIRNRP